MVLFLPSNATYRLIKVSKGLRHRSKVLLTFDIEGPPKKEDFFDRTSLMCLKIVLELLERNDFRGIFFITGSAAEQIRRHPDLVELLDHHEIGYHSSSHTVSPRIVEYTDIASYEEARTVSLKRETSHVNPKTGSIEGEGGILSLRKTFAEKNIVGFRAPFLSWSPPHLEALRKLGITYDFSSDISRDPVFFRRITFYPSPISIDGIEATFFHRGPNDIFPRFLTSLFLQRGVTVLFMHPSGSVNAITDKASAKFAFSFLQFFFNRLRFLEQAGIIELTSSLSKGCEPLDVRNVDVESIYQASVRAPMRLFGLRPRFIRSHFTRFFGQDKDDE